MNDYILPEEKRVVNEIKRYLRNMERIRKRWLLFDVKVNAFRWRLSQLGYEIRTINNKKTLVKLTNANR